MPGDVDERKVPNTPQTNIENERPPSAECIEAQRVDPICSGVQAKETDPENGNDSDQHRRQRKLAKSNVPTYGAWCADDGAGRDDEGRQGRQGYGAQLNDTKDFQYAIPHSTQRYAPYIHTTGRRLTRCSHKKLPQEGSHAWECGGAGYDSNEA